MMEMGARQRMNNERAVPPSGLFLGNPQSTLLDRRRQPLAHLSSDRFQREV